MEKGKSGLSKNNYRRLLKLLSPRFQDITPMFDDSVPFLVSGEMLMLTAVMDENYNRSLGGQSLHMIYLTERLLNTFARNNGKFEIVFFNIWENVFDDWNLYLSREIVMRHFQNNTKYAVHQFPHVHDTGFIEYIDKVRPGFFLYNLSVIFEHTFLKEYSCTFQELLITFCAEFVFCLKIDLPIVDLQTVQVDSSVVKAYVLESDLDSIKLIPDLKNDLLEISRKTKMFKKMASPYKCREIREWIICNTVQEFLESFPEQINDARRFILYMVILENLNLEDRASPVVKEIDKNIIMADILAFKKIMVSLLSGADTKNFDWKNIADIWQGTLLAVVYSCFNSALYDRDLDKLSASYEDYINKINGALKTKIHAYPIEPYNKEFCKFELPYCRKSVEVPLQPVDNPIVKVFCNSILDYVTWADPVEILSKRTSYFNEIRHWHSRKPISDDFDNTKDSEAKERAVTRKEKVHASRMQSKQARFMTLYGTNLVGHRNIYETILCEEDSKPLKNKKESKKAIEIKLQIAKETEENTKKIEKEKVSSLKSEFKKLSRLEDLKKLLPLVETYLKKNKYVESKLEWLLLKAKILDKIYSKQVGLAGVSNDDVKDLFLVIREILKIHHEGCDLACSQQQKLSTILQRMGFGSIAALNGLPTTETTVSCPYTNEDFIYFQLKYCGTELERQTEGSYDPDVGFIPDAWQENLIEAIRKNQSALIVAPTSSGKTFASYYCIKRILQKSKNGIVVYVSPTKALVNQVAATLHMKFKNVYSQPGIATVGVFTRDYRINGVNSRVLVTVPQCLEILLMSPRRYTWSNKLKYVIFDEVHCLKGQGEQGAGVTWERCLLLIRCPFLALSATVRNPEYFHEWLQTTEKFKEEQDLQLGFERLYDSKVNLVVHSDRHTDLVKYTYLKDERLHHCHPYAFLDPVILELHNGIPSGMNLSSNEIVQLFVALKNHAPDYVKNDADLNNFFISNSRRGFITYNDKRNYEQVLSSIFYEVYKRDTNKYKSILADLQPVQITNEVGSLFCIENIIELLQTLHDKKMLPAIIFSYNRKLTEALAMEVTEHWEDMKLQMAKSSRQIRHEEKLDKKRVKQLHKLEAKDGIEGQSFKASQKCPLNLLEETESFLKGKGKIDKDDIQFIEERLQYTSRPYKDMLIRAIKQGVAFHHAGLNNKFRSATEMLFRMGILKVVFATGTLAMGIHMPCKTTVICGDSIFMNSLEYQQMSGRAGRRGFDNEGNVVFMGINRRRQKTLLTSKLPVTDGNFPLSMTLIMRLMLLVKQVTDSGKKTEECSKRTFSSVMTLLENSLLYMKNPLLRIQMKHFICFGTQLLYLQNLIGHDGFPLKMCSLITHLHYHEPANFAFVYILRNGALRKMINDNIGDNGKIQWNILIIMNFLYARLRLHEKQKNREYNNSCVVLEPLPGTIKEALENYNREVKFVFDEYFASTSRYCLEKYGLDNTLPLSGLKFKSGATDCFGNDNILRKVEPYCQRRSICSAFASLSSCADNDLYSEKKLISNIRNEVCPDVKIVPIIDLDLEINSYAVDFYRHRIVQAIVKDNGLKHGEEFARLKDFLLVLKTVVLALEELEPKEADDLILHHFKEVASKYEKYFNEAFYS